MEKVHLLSVTSGRSGSLNILRIIFSSVPYVMFVIILSRHLGFEFAKTYYWWFAAFFVIGLIGKFAMHLAAKRNR